MELEIEEGAPAEEVQPVAEKQRAKRSRKAVALRNLFMAVDGKRVKILAGERLKLSTDKFKMMLASGLVQEDVEED